MQTYPSIPPRLIFPNQGEALTHLVQNKKASDLEERSARAIDKLPDWGYSFRIRISPFTHKLSHAFTNLKGELEIDFLARRGRTMIPILVDGEIGHYLADWQKVVDEQKTSEINLYMQAYGAMPAVRVEYWRLANQDMADAYYRELLR